MLQPDEVLCPTLGTLSFHSEPPLGRLLRCLAENFSCRGISSNSNVLLPPVFGKVWRKKI